MADTGSSANAQKQGATPSGGDAVKNAGGSGPAPGRVEAQAGDPYRPDGGNDYSLSIEPEDTGEATVANLFQAVPLENEGSDSADAGAGGRGGDGTGPDGASAGGFGMDGGGGGSGGVRLPGGGTDVVETSDGLQNDDAGIGDGAVPQARGPDAELSQFDLGGNGVRAAGSGVGDGTGGGVQPDDDGGGDDGDGGGGGDGEDVGPVTDVDTVQNVVAENASGGTVVGVTAFAEDPDGTDTVSYAITDDRFEIDPDTGVITVADGAVLDHETTPFIDIEVTATSTDGSTSTGTFRVTVGDENEAPIGPVTDTDTVTNSVQENASGGTVVGVTAFAEDPDGTDTVSYSITDDRFEIDPDTGVITVTDGAVLDHETTPFIDIEVTATSTDGSTSTGTFRVTVGDENEAPIGPVTDVDVTGNAVSEDATAGDVVGISAFAEDPDATDTVTYEMSGDDRFEIDPESGVITVADGAHFDAETEPAIDVLVTATSTDGTTSQETFSIGITDANEPPDLVVCLENGALQFVVNGSFETFEGTLSGTDPEGYYENPTSIEGWSHENVDIQQSARWDAGTSDGDHRLDLSANQNGTAAQQIDGMLEGQVYTFSFDATARGGIGETVAEVYWNGELIGTVDPAEAGASWQSYSYNIVGGAGDGTDTLTFVEVGGGNSSFGTFIDNVSIVSDSRIAVVEEFHGAEIAPLKVFDPDVGDTHSFTLSDDRFEVVVSEGKYVLKLKDDRAFDYETETQVSVDVTVTDSGGLSDTETVVIDVLDIDENVGPVGPVTDNDTAVNSVAENGSGGEYVGVTAFADDPDTADTVTYSIPDDRFEIDPDTGVITVAEGVSFDHETLPSVDIEVTATSSDGSVSTGPFTIEITDVNEPPDLTVHLETGATQFAVNGSFEVYDGSLGGTDGSGWYQNPNTIEGWTYDNVDVHQAGHMGFGASDGDHHLDLAALTNGWASQKIDGQLDGQVYHLSFDMKSRGSTGQSVAEVYWNGELIDTIDPATTGSGWQTFSYDIVGASGDGSNTLSFVEIGSDNNGGALIDSVSIVSDHRTAVVEEFYGAEIAPLSVIDPDAGDGHSFTVSDDRFEVIASDGAYLLKLKSDQAFDYETETQVTVEVTATDSGGLSDTETVIIDVIDVDDINAPVGPLRDADTSPNTVAENGSGGVATGIAAIAVDPDPADSVTYSITDNRFEIDPDTGVITVADGVSFDHEALPSVDVEVTATSSDGSASNGVFTIDIADINEAPVLGFDPVLGPGVAVTMTLLEENAGHSNVFGVYHRDANGDPEGGQIVWVDPDGLSPGDTTTVFLEGVQAADVGYFLIPDGASINGGLADGDQVSFRKDGDGNWQAVLGDGTLLAGRDANVFFSGDGTLNPDGYDYTAESGITIGFEDVARGGDRDYNDLIFDQTLSVHDADATIDEGDTGAEVGTIEVTDPDLGDVHSFTVSDDRFEVIARNGDFVLKFKDDAVIDHENEDSITLDVTATDRGGLTDTQTLTLDVIDAGTDTAGDYGTDGADVMTGDGGRDAQFGRGGDDSLLGQGGNDHLYGGTGDDVLRGGIGTDHMDGGDGSDLFAYMLGDGNDTMQGGAGLNWIDIVDLSKAPDGTDLGSYGTDWSVTMTEGTIENVDALGGEITLSQDAGGYIELADGARIDFSEMESIQY
ncbi:cadherin domain-containing protein [Roseibium sp.]|uniref:cadherin domain-containing protein n=3 Tax=Roseibium sp. TaxID=1936156 RepID=UPI003264D1E4